MKTIHKWRKLLTTEAWLQYQCHFPARVSEAWKPCHTWRPGSIYHLVYSLYRELEALTPCQSMVVSISLQFPIVELYTTKFHERTGLWCWVVSCKWNFLQLSRWGFAIFSGFFFGFQFNHLSLGTDNLAFHFAEYTTGMNSLVFLFL